jgi:hypothetical protein
VEFVLIIVVVAVALAGLAMVLSRAAGARPPSAVPAAEAGADGLAALGPGVLVRHRGERLIVERTLHFANGDERWVEHRLADDGRGRSLWLEIQRRDGLEIFVYERLPDGGDPPSGDELARDGVAYTFSERGSASYRSEERAGPAKQGSVEFVEYAAGRRRLAYERFDAGRWEISTGQRAEPADLEVG